MSNLGLSIWLPKLIINLLKYIACPVFTNETLPNFNNMVRFWSILLEKNWDYNCVFTTSSKRTENSKVELNHRNYELTMSNIQNKKLKWTITAMCFSSFFFFGELQLWVYHAKQTKPKLKRLKETIFRLQMCGERYKAAEDLLKLSGRLRLLMAQVLTITNTA